MNKRIGRLFVNTVQRLSLRWLVVSLLLIVTGLTWTGRTVRGQEIWEYSPYQVKVWVTFDDSPEFSSTLRSNVSRTIESMAEQVDLSGWRVTVGRPEQPKNKPNADTADSSEDESQADQPAPVLDWESLLRQWNWQITHQLDHLQLPSQPQASKAWLQGDKLILVALRKRHAQFEVLARELDCTTQTLGPVIRYQSLQSAVLPRLAFQAVAEAFLPLVRIDEVDGKKVLARIRAGGLVVRPDASAESGVTDNHASPAWVDTQDVLLPVIRRTDRLGLVTEGGIRVLNWTFLAITEHTGTQLRCDIHSAMRAPLAGRSGRRTQKLALVVRPTLATTRLFLQSRDEQPRPLSGYQVYSRQPNREESTLLGKTDWRGALDIEKSDSTLRILYIKSGTRLLARLPIVPGMHEDLSAQMYNDEIRLRAEGIVKRLENDLLDLVARRELLVTRIRSRLKQNQIEAAKDLYKELTSLTTRDDFNLILTGQRRLCSSNDQREQRHIDQHFNELSRLAGNQLTSEVINNLGRDISLAEKGELLFPDEPDDASDAASTDPEPSTDAET